MGYKARGVGRGSKPDKLMRDALLAELCVEIEDPADRGKKIKRLRLIARKLIDLAISGDVQAIREVNDRVDGKVAQAIAGEDGGKIQHSIEVSFVSPKPQPARPG